MNQRVQLHFQQVLNTKAKRRLQFWVYQLLNNSQFQISTCPPAVTYSCKPGISKMHWKCVGMKPDLDVQKEAQGKKWEEKELKHLTGQEKKSITTH